jgi:hypothetical protein
MNGTKLKKNKEKEIPDLFNIISDFQYLIITINGIQHLVEISILIINLKKKLLI